MFSSCSQIPLIYFLFHFISDSEMAATLKTNVQDNKKNDISTVPAIVNSARYAECPSGMPEEIAEGSLFLVRSQIPNVDVRTRV